MTAVNDYFHQRLIALPEIASYLDNIAANDEHALIAKRDNRRQRDVVWVMPLAVFDT